MSFSLSIMVFEVPSVTAFRRITPLLLRTILPK
jgi:hypothetical protein